MLAFKKLLTESKPDIAQRTDDSVPTGLSQYPNLGFKKPRKMKGLVGSFP